MFGSQGLGDVRHLPATKASFTRSILYLDRANDNGGLAAAALARLTPTTISCRRAWFGCGRVQSSSSGWESARRLHAARAASSNRIVWRSAWRTGTNLVVPGLTPGVHRSKVPVHALAENSDA